MDEAIIYDCLLIGMYLLAALTVAILLFRTAAYGRHSEPGWGPTLPNRLGWILMESPASITVALVSTMEKPNIGALVLLLMWEIHYIHRAFIFPFWMSKGTPMPISIAAMAFCFNLYNGYLNGRGLTRFGPNHDASWFSDPRFLVGVTMFFTGMAVNLHADRILAKLRPPGDKGYYIPQGGLFRWLSCPNYFGEMVEWFGWAIATWSLPGLAFAIYTVANLAPRALAHHRWYQRKFDNYPKERRAFIPYLI